ncbi:MarR family winged helix-turn-helix transcriptional regulator [Demequina sp. NBRC 110054]|uniref:MarR family winged helix-turn-helix transcriptional regulator n=1 Tax=Demequina sp. NBRC 110054 TaxID=1570343 RepID=UPI00190EBF3C|nr:MarR family winged helix-turn-helix transcriptional regulator [Demequina sp. NBRC 110054]
MEIDDQEPQRYTGYLIRRAQQAHLAMWSRVVSTEITSVQYSILVILDQCGQASQRELCDRVDLDRSTVADLVRRMERRGLVARARDVDDARRNTVTLTEHGLAERARLKPLVEEANRRLTEGLSAEQREALRAGLRALLEG